MNKMKPKALRNQNPDLFISGAKFNLIPHTRSQNEVTPPPENQNSDNIFDQTLVSSPVDISMIQTANRTLKEHLERKEPLTSPIRNYVLRMASRLEQSTTRNNMNEEEIQALKKVISARKRTTAGFRGILKGVHCVTRPALLGKIREREMELKEKEQKRVKRGTKKLATPPQISITNRGNILEDDGNSIESD